MRQLSKFVRFAPKLFYIATGITLFLGIVIPMIELKSLGYSMDLPTESGFAKSALASLIIREVTESLYLLANGLILEVLIAIWDKLRPAASKEAAE